MRTKVMLAAGFLATLAAATGVTPQGRDLLTLSPQGELSGAFAETMKRHSALAFAPDEFSGGLIFNVRDDAFVADGPLALPDEEFSVGAVVSVETPRRWGGIIGAVEDNGGAEQGWILGYDTTSFTFGISTEATDDGDGRLVYIKADRDYELGVGYLVSASYDGTRAQLFVNGRLAAESQEVGGHVLLAGEARLTIGAYRDRDEFHPHDGRIGALELTSRKAGGAYYAARLAGRKDMKVWTDTPFGWSVEPYLTWPRQKSMSVLAETTWPSTAVVRYRHESVAEWTEKPIGDGAVRLHEAWLKGLTPDAKHFYQVVVTQAATEGTPLVLESEVRSFRTAPDSDDDAFMFVVIGDTQTNGDVAKRVSDLAFEQRPHLVVHCGDLVDAGGNKTDWTETFFPSMRPLIEHAPLVSVLGNHEQDAQLYYDYMALPSPERWYALRYGCAEFFMIDGNRSLADQSAQLEWLEGALAASTAKWRFAVLHQPPYTSDSNDYGDTLVESSTRGDMNVRNIVKLLEEYRVDICFSGHVHDYERTFPIRGGKVVPHANGGIMYVTSAGGGGPLEDFDGTNTWFGHKKARRHHFVQIALHGDLLELHMVDETGRLFDTVTLTAR